MLFFAAVAGLCIHSFLQNSANFEIPAPYEHFFTLPQSENPTRLDLNTATAAQLAKIPGISRPLAERIVEYRKENGGFSSLSELLEIEGMHDSLFATLGDYLYLTPRESETVPTTTQISTQGSTEVTSTITQAPTQLLLDLNRADVTELCLLPDIGIATAEAIVEYRSSIGGFRNRSQLLAVKGIGEATLSRIMEHLYIENEQPMQEETTAATDPQEIPVININTATAEQLLLLPNCTQELAENVIYLREHIHGFVNILEVLYTEGITDAIYISWEPYLAVDDEGNTRINKEN